MALGKRHVVAGGLAAAVAIAVPVIRGHEGVVLHVYRDAIGKPTYCVGETENPKWGHRYTMQECDAILQTRVDYFAEGTKKCVPADIPVKTRASFIDFAYNVGVGNFCHSTLAVKANSGDLKGACAELSKWVYAGGRKLRGLVLRRGDEKALCLEGLK